MEVKPSMADLPVQSLVKVPAVIFLKFPTRSLHHSVRYKMYLYDNEIGDNKLVAYTRRLMFRVMSMGPIPQHIAFMMDGNKRFAKKWGLEEEDGNRSGIRSLMYMLKYCYELGVKCITIFGFSMDNLKRRPHEVEYVTDIMLDVIQWFLIKESSISQFGVRVMFIGDLKQLDEPVRVAAKKAMEATAHHTNTMLLICVAYSSDQEIKNAVDESCKEKWGLLNSCAENGGSQEFNGDIKVVDIEKRMYTSISPADPDILFRSADETRLSNFLLWQTTNTLLYSPKALWPELGLMDFIWAVVQFQSSYSYLEKKKKRA